LPGSRPGRPSAGLGAAPAARYSPTRPRTAPTPATLLARSRHASVRSLERYPRPGPEAVAAHVAATDQAARRCHCHLLAQLRARVRVAQQSALVAPISGRGCGQPLLTPGVGGTTARL